MPLFVLAELRLGVARSRQTEENAAQVDALVARCEVISADLTQFRSTSVSETIWPKCEQFRIRSKNAKGFGHDIWIAALCLQHQLPLLTNDSLFDQVGALEVVHW